MGEANIGFGLAVIGEFRSIISVKSIRRRQTIINQIPLIANAIIPFDFAARFRFNGQSKTTVVFLCNLSLSYHLILLAIQTQNT